MSPLDVLAEELGAVAGRIERESGLRIAAALSDMQRREAETELRFARLEQAIAARLAEVQDGAEGKQGEPGSDGERGEPGDKGEVGERGPAGPALDAFDTELKDDGRTLVLRLEDERLIASHEIALHQTLFRKEWTKRTYERGDIVSDDGSLWHCDEDTSEQPSKAGAGWSVFMPRGERGLPGQDGSDGRDGVDGRDGIDGKDGAQGERGFDGERGEKGEQGERGADGQNGRDGVDGRDGERGPEGPAGKLPLAKAWTDDVHYEGDVVTCDGQLFQAVKDTARKPGHEDWICLAARGSDGRSLRVRGTFDAAAAYQAMDVVALNSSSFVALHDAPGACPGAGWQALAIGGRRGERGERGEPGKRGEPGESGPTIVAWDCDATNYRATPIMSDGSTGPDLDLLPFMERYHAEAGR